jgi:hypothetical protein
MSESSGAQDASTLVLRISIPAGAEYQVIVKELAAKVAAYLGDTDPDGRVAADALDEVTRMIRSGGPGRAGSDGSGHGANNPNNPNNDEDVIFEFRQTEDALLVRAARRSVTADARGRSRPSLRRQMVQAMDTRLHLQTRQPSGCSDSRVAF